MFQTSFTFSDYGYGAAIASLLSVLCLMATIVIFRTSRRDLTKG
jgi:multiple sugar transport system permease protein/raffinose/stachyose/melibiose transport system permease protein